MKNSMATQQFSRIDIEPLGGVAGDMMLAALLHLGAARSPIDQALANLSEPGLRLDVEPVCVDGIDALHVRSIAAAKPQHGHQHLGDILALIRKAALPADAEALARRIFAILARAESHVHGGSSDTVGLHEVGELDSVFDVIGVSLAVASLGFPTFRCTPIPSGHGVAVTQHGVLACPVPAVAAIVSEHGIPLVSVDVEGETVTPTGAAVLAALAPTWLSSAAADPYDASGAGAGSRRFPGRANVVRVFGSRDA